MRRRAAPIVGPAIPDQTELRVLVPVRDLDEFLDFLARLEDVFGPIERKQDVTTGDRFLL